MLLFAFTTLGYMFSIGLAQNKIFIAVGSALLFWLLTLINIYGTRWTKIINSISAWCGTFIPSLILILLALVWLITGHTMQTDYSIGSAWLQDFKHWETIVFISSMMFTFAGLELAPMMAGRMQNPQRHFARAIAITAVVIVGIYMTGTWALNTLLPANQTDIIVGVMQAIHSAASTLPMPWLLPVMACCLFFGVLGQINSWLIGPIYMLQEASRTNHLSGKRISQLHSKYQTPAFALNMQAIIVTLLCFFAFLSPSMTAAHWMLTGLTTITYFIPYLVLFPAFYRLRIIKPDVHRSFKIPGNIFPLVLSGIGFFSIIFTMFLLFIPPAEINVGNYFAYVSKMIGGVFLAFALAESTYYFALKRNKKLSTETGK